jgi:hypothetical protein
MKAKKVLEQLRSHGYSPWLDGDSLYLPNDAPQWAVNEAKAHTPALKALLRYEHDVSRAHELEDSINGHANESHLPEYEHLLATFAETERTLRFYGCTAHDFAELFDTGRTSHG